MCVRLLLLVLVLVLFHLFICCCSFPFLYTFVGIDLRKRMVASGTHIPKDRDRQKHRKGRNDVHKNHGKNYDESKQQQQFNFFASFPATMEIKTAMVCLSSSLFGSCKWWSGKASCKPSKILLEYVNINELIHILYDIFLFFRLLSLDLRFVCFPIFSMLCVCLLGHVWNPCISVIKYA